MSVREKNHVGLWENYVRFGKIHVSLWEKSCRFVGKIMLVCGKNHVGLWENFVGQKTSPKNTRTCTEIKYWNIYVYLPRYRVSQRLFDGKFVET